MNLIQITPGAGGMYCGNCFRDNALVAALKRQGHDALLIPLYLPMTLDEPDQGAGTPVFFGGISVYLEQRSALFRKSPSWLRQWLSHPKLLKWASGRAAKTKAAEVGDITVSMLRGEQGHQAAELETLIGWLRSQPRPDAIGLSNAMLAGLGRRLKAELGAPVLCMLQGEDAFLDGLPEPHRTNAWSMLSERVKELDGLAAPSQYFAELMGRRMGVPASSIHVIPNGVHVAGFKQSKLNGDPPVIGYFARQCAEKGLDLLAEAFIRLKARPAMKRLRLKIGGSHGPSDDAFVSGVKRKFEQAGVMDCVEFHPNLDRAAKLDFYSSLSVFSVPAHYGEAFGLYLAEAWAAGVPVVQPRVAAFPELVESSGGGLLCEPHDADSLASALGRVLDNPPEAARMGAAGRTFAERHLTGEAMASGWIRLVQSVR